MTSEQDLPEVEKRKTIGYSEGLRRSSIRSRASRSGNLPRMTGERSASASLPRMSGERSAGKSRFPAVAGFWGRVNSQGDFEAQSVSPRRWRRLATFGAWLRSSKGGVRPLMPYLLSALVGATTALIWQTLQPSPTPAPRPASAATAAAAKAPKPAAPVAAAAVAPAAPAAAVTPAAAAAVAPAAPAAAAPAPSTAARAARLAAPVQRATPPAGAAKPEVKTSAPRPRPAKAPSRRRLNLDEDGVLAPSFL